MDIILELLIVNLCKMIFLPPYVVHGTHSITPENIQEHRHKIEKILSLLRDDQVEIEKVKSLNYINDYQEQT